MTREESIKRLEDTFEAWEGWVPHNDSPANKLSEALGMAIAVLREQEERSKGCDRCSEKLSKDFPFSPAERQRLTLHSKHCAWCGRKLEVEG